LKDSIVHRPAKTQRILASGEFDERAGPGQEEYIRNQLKEDKEYEQLTMKELFDPFTGEPVMRDKK